MIEYVENAWSESDTDVELIFRRPPSRYVFIISDSVWETIVERAGLNSKVAEAVRKVYAHQATDLLQTTTGMETPSLGDDQVFLVITLPDTDVWQRSKMELSRWFEELAKEGLSPAEILDFWMVEHRSYTPNEWGEARGVSAEAVRKNNRQAREKLVETPYWRI